MAQTTTPTMTVLHLETGHVLAAASGGAHALTVDDLTGGSFLAVRLPDSAQRVAVPANLLKAAVYELDDDVLSRPLQFRVDDKLPTLVFGGVPVDLGASGAEVEAPDGTAVLSLWQVGDDFEVGRSVLKSGKPDVKDPPGLGDGVVVPQLVACAGEPLAFLHPS